MHGPRPAVLAEIMRKGFWMQFLFLVDRIAFVYGVHRVDEQIKQFMNEFNNNNNEDNSSDTESTSDFEYDDCVDSDGTDTSYQSTGSATSMSSSCASSVQSVEVARSAVDDLRDTIIAGGVRLRLRALSVTV